MSISDRLPTLIPLFISIALIVTAIALLLHLRREIAPQKTEWLAIVFVAAWPFVFYWTAALRQAVFYYGDVFLVHYPFHLAYANALREGRLPLWAPDIFAGFPLLAEGQLGALYPMRLFLYGLLPIDLATNYDILFHLAWVSVGMYLFVRALGMQRPSALLAALAFGTGGFFYARLQHMNILSTASWLPWLMWAWEEHELETDRRRRWHWLALAALFSGIQWLGGQPQFAFLSLLLLVMYSVVRWKRDQDTPSSRNSFFEYVDLKRLIPLGFALCIGVALSAMQLLPMYELATFSTRSEGLDLASSALYSLRPIHFLMLFDPFVLGNPFPSVSIELVGYIGLLPIVLAFVAPFARRDRRSVFFLLVALVALYLGLGEHSWLYGALFRHLPGFSYFRVPSRFFFWSSFAFAILAATTFDALLARAWMTAHWTRAQKIVLGIFAVFIAVFIALMPAMPLEVWLSAWTWLPWFFATVTLFILFGAWRRLLTRTTLATLVLGLSVIDLALFASVYSKTYNATTSVADFYAPPRSLSVLKDLSPQDGRVLTSLWIYPSMSTMRESLYPNSSMTYGAPSAIGYTPLLTQRAAEYLGQITPQMLNLMNVRYYLIPQLLSADLEIEGKNLENPFGLRLGNDPALLSPTRVTKIKITSSLARSVDLHTGDVVAQIGLEIEGGTWVTIPLRAGLDTAEWAYERSDVRRVIQHSMPAIATTFPARSAIPVEAHDGHTYLAQFDVARNGQPLVITGAYLRPLISPSLLRIERFVLVTPEGKEVSLAHLTGRDDQNLIYRTDDVAIFENQDVLPRTFLVHDVHVADDKAVVAEMRRDEFKPQQTLILAEGDAVHAVGFQREEEYARIVVYQPERVVLSVHASAEGYTFLADSWYPGWIAHVDGDETPIRRADLIFRAVHISPGTHQIELEYRPMSLYVGAMVSLIALVSLLGIVVRSWL